MECAAQALSLHRERLMSLENVVGVGIGTKWVSGRQTDEPAVLVLVSKKVPSANLAKSQSVPRAFGKTATDVIEVGEIKLLTSRTEKIRPAMPGVSIGHFRVTAGTFGAMVRDRHTGDPLILSNNHVLANITDGRDGRAQVGDPIWQPGRYDGGTEDDVIGYLERFIPLWRPTVPSHCKVACAAERSLNAILQKVYPQYEVHLLRRSQFTNLVDAAVARPIKKDAMVPEVMEIGAITGMAEPTVGLKVRKSGRTSGLSNGEVLAVQTSIRVSMGDVGIALFEEQILLSPMGQPGDSGSLIVTEDNRAVSLLSAGSDKATLAGNIKTVCDLLKVDLW